MRRLPTDRTVTSLTFSPDGRWLAAGGWQHLSLWDPHTAAEVPIEQEPCDHVLSVVFTQGGQGLAWVVPFMNWDAEIRFGSVAERRQIRREALRRGGEPGLAALPDGRVLVRGSGHASYWDPATCEQVAHAPPGVTLWLSPAGVVPAVLRKKKLRPLVPVPDGSYLARAKDNVLEVWQPGHDKPLLRATDKPSFLSASFTPNGRHLLAGRSDKVITLWDSHTWTMTERLDWDIGCAECLAVSPDGLTAAASGYGGEIVIWDLDL